MMKVPNTTISTMQLLNTYRTLLTPQAIISVGYSYPISITASRLSLLFLLRRIFRMQVLWFRIGWWAISSLVVAWLIMSLAFGSLHNAGRVSLEFEYDYAIPAVTFTNAFIDLFVLVLPLGMTYGLQLPTKQRAAVAGIFALGSAYVILFSNPLCCPSHCMRDCTVSTIPYPILTPPPPSGTVTSLVRAARSIQSKQEHWDPRYQLYSEAMIGLAEAATINICACLPTLRPLFRGMTKVTKKGFSSIGMYASSTARSRRTQGSGHRTQDADADADASIVLKDHPAVIARTVEWHVESRSDDGNLQRDSREGAHGGS
jgi:hypothetical protein